MQTTAPKLLSTVKTAPHVCLRFSVPAFLFVIFAASAAILRPCFASFTALNLCFVPQRYLNLFAFPFCPHPNAASAFLWNDIMNFLSLTDNRECILITNLCTAKGLFFILHSHPIRSASIFGRGKNNCPNVSPVGFTLGRFVFQFGSFSSWFFPTHFLHRKCFDKLLEFLPQLFVQAHLFFHALLQPPTLRLCVLIPARSARSFTVEQSITW